MPASPQTRRRHAFIALAAASFFAVVLYRFPPAEHGFYPRCPIYALTGWQCPGCGMTRALAALLHGDVAAAIHLNPLITLVLPIAMFYMLFAFKRGDWPRLPTPIVQAVFIVTILFTIARNLA
jgi:hypothetical protein